MKPLLVAAATAAAVLTLGGAAAALRWAATPPAVAATHTRAVRLFNAMETYSGSTALDQAREASRYGGVRVLVAHDGPAGREIVLAVTATSTSSSRFDVQLFPDSDRPVFRATRCYRWTQDRRWDTAEEVDCPRGRRVDRSPGPATDPIPPGADRRVHTALLHEGGTAAVRAALADLHAEVRRVHGAIAVAVAGVTGYDSGRQVNECLLGYRRGETVRVWRPLAVQVAAGEATCDAAAALSPALRHPPH